VGGGGGHLEALAAAAGGPEAQGLLSALVAGLTVDLVVYAVARRIVAVHKQLPAAGGSVSSYTPPGGSVSAYTPPYVGLRVCGGL